METALCQGPSCGRCLKVCPANAVQYWDRDWPACDEYRSPHGFAKLTDHVDKIIAAGDPTLRKELLRSEDSFNLWQSILRGAGVITGCRRCADVCPVGADYEQLRDALDHLPESTPEKEDRAAGMAASESRKDTAEGYERQKRWIGARGYLGETGD